MDQMRKYWDSPEKSCPLASSHIDKRFIHAPISAVGKSRITMIKNSITMLHSSTKCVMTLLVSQQTHRQFATFSAFSELYGYENLLILAPLAEAISLAYF